MNLRLEYDSFQDFANRLWPCLSEEGMWVRSENPAAVGEIVDFDVMLADGFRLFHGTGQVIAVGEGPRDGESGEGMTLRFSQLDQPSRNLVRKVVSKHIGEGGRLFVLATPATKVEVVGGEEGGPQGPSGGGELVTPFADFETDASWNQGSEPELKSFLRPSGRGGEPVEPTPEPVSGFDFDPGSDVEKTVPPVAELVSTADGSVDSEDSESSESSEDAWLDGLPDDGEDADDESAESAAGQSMGDLFPDLGDEARGAFGETQRIEPSQLASEPESEIHLEEETVFGPLPSTVIPPAFPKFDDASSGGVESDEPSTDEFLVEGLESGGSRWPLVVVGGLVVGVALFALVNMGGPMSEWFGDSAPETPAAQTETPAGREAATRPSLPMPGAEEEAASATEEAAGSPESEDPDIVVETPEESQVGATDAAAAAARAERIAARAEARKAAAEAAAEDAPAAAVTTPEPSAAVVPTAEPSTAVVPTPRPVEGATLRLRRITWRQEGEDTIVRLALEGTATAGRFETLRVAGDNPRLVLKINGVAGSVPRGPVPIGSRDVTQLRFGVHDVEGVRQVHVVADLTAAAVQLVGPVAIDDGGVELRFRQP